MAKRMTGMISIRVHSDTIEKLKQRHLQKKKIIEKKDPEINYSFQDFLRELLEKGLD